MTVYVCNPASNPECAKNSCFLIGGECHCTTHVEFAMHDKSGNPITEYWPDEPDA